MTKWILIGSLATTLFAGTACDSNEPEPDETSGGEKIEEGAEDAADAVDETAEDAADSIDDATE